MKYHAPVDPDCPVVAEFESLLLNDPMTEAYGMGSEIMEAFERKHRGKCKRCQEFGAANIEVI